MRKPRFTGKRFVVAIKGENHIRPGIGQFKAIFPNFPLVAFGEILDLWTRRIPAQPLIVRAEIHRPQSFVGVTKAVHLVSTVRQVPKHKIVFGIFGVNQRLQPAKVLHPFGNRSADDADVLPFLEIQFRLCVDRRSERDTEDENTKMPLHSGDSSGWIGKDAHSERGPFQTDRLAIPMTSDDCEATLPVEHSSDLFLRSPSEMQKENRIEPLAA